MIQLENVSKIFGTGVAGLSDITLTVDKGEFVFLMGHTGSGKTTLLRLLTREMLPTQGTITVGGWDIVKLPSSKVSHLRKRIGVVFQDLKLLMDQTIWENIMLPLEVAGIKESEAHTRAQELLARVGIESQRDKFPVQLSGGELQRAAIARALTLAPDILLADEPTGNLDSQTAFEIVTLLSRINETGTTVIMATHNEEIVKKLSKRIVVLEKGRIAKDDKKEKKHEEQKEVDAKKHSDKDTKHHEEKKSNARSLESKSEHKSTTKVSGEKGEKHGTS